jgi:hypothetical protein
MQFYYILVCFIRSRVIKTRFDTRCRKNSFLFDLLSLIDLIGASELTEF